MKEYKVTATLKVNASLFLKAKNRQEAKELALDKYDLLQDLWDNADNEEAIITVE